MPKKDLKKRKPVDKKPEKASEEAKKKVGEKESRTKKKSEAKVVSNDVEAAAVVHENGNMVEADDGGKEEMKIEKSEAVNGPEEEVDVNDIKQTEHLNRPVSAKFKKRTPSARKLHKGRRSRFALWVGCALLKHLLTVPSPANTVCIDGELHRASLLEKLLSLEFFPIISECGRI